MARQWMTDVAAVCIHTPEPAKLYVEIPGTIVVKTEVWIELFSGKQVIVGR
jgi:hypothetical protein